jgi:hypothetical protein
MAKKDGTKTGGRRKGTPNKLTSQVKDMILQALSDAGGVEYLKEQATKSPAAFLSLVGKVLPLQITGEGGGAVVIKWQD